MSKYENLTSYDIFCSNSENSPDAIAYIHGGPLAPNLKGRSLFYQLQDCVYIVTYVSGMPTILSNGEISSFHGFHIHTVGDCTIGDPKNPFLDSKGHYNPTNEPHPYHAGDLPPLLSNNCCAYGSSMMSVTTNRFKLCDVIGKSIIIHEDPDDFMSQPTGHAGLRWACGIIEENCKPYEIVK